jgi:hypothetical protein
MTTAGAWSGCSTAALSAGGYAAFPELLVSGVGSVYAATGTVGGTSTIMSGNLNVNGPILRDRLLFFASFQRDNRVSSIPGDPRGRFPDHPPRHFQGIRYLGKLNWQANESTQVINLSQFVDAESIDPMYVDRSYYLAPDGKVAAESFAVMREGMRGKAGIGKVALYGREYLVAVRASGRGLVHVRPWSSDTHWWIGQWSNVLLLPVRSGRRAGRAVRLRPVLREGGIRDRRGRNTGRGPQVGNVPPVRRGPAGPEPP